LCITPPVFHTQRLRTGLVKKKDELGLKGRLTGHFKPEMRQAVVNVIKKSMTKGMTQEKACGIFAGYLPENSAAGPILSP